MGWGIRRPLMLEPLSYQPQALLQRTKEFSEPEPLLSECQIMSRSYFVHTFTTGGRAFRLDETETQLRSLMHSLDNFFFSGLLTGGTDPIVRLIFGKNIFGQIGTQGEGAFLLGRTSGVVYASNVKLTIEVEACNARSSFTAGHYVKTGLDSLLETLVHEMAQAYYMSFICPCLCCQAELGAYGHGPAWQELKQSMYITMREWHPSLASFYINDRDDLVHVNLFCFTGGPICCVSRGRVV